MWPFYYLTLFHTASEWPRKTTIGVIHFHLPLFKGRASRKNNNDRSLLRGLNTSRDKKKCGNAGEIWKPHQYQTCCLKYSHRSISTVWGIKREFFQICLIKSNSLLCASQHNSNGSRSNNTIQPSNTSINYTMSIFWDLCVEIH